MADTFGRLFVGLINLFRALGNLWRRVLRRRVDYVRIELRGSLPEFVDTPTWWQRRLLRQSTPMSMASLRRVLQRTAADPQTRGVFLVLNGFGGGWATLQSLRDELLHFRASGKRVVAYVYTLNNAGYYVACAADEIIVPPTASFDVLGLHTEIQFLRDALAKVGIAAEVEAVSPYKSAGDTFIRNDISPENRAQLERILDERYAELVRAIAEGRSLAPDAVRAAIDDAPLTASAASERGLVDTLLYEDELEAHLSNGEQPFKMLNYDVARKALRITPARYQRQFVAVVPIEGTIVAGASRNLPLPLPLFGAQQAGSESVAQALRRAERDKRVAAVVLYVNSGGGDAFASDLMWREVLRVRQQKPVVVAMGDVAASGGYYLAAPASTIIAQPGTITGSIGVISLRPIVGGLLERAGINTVTLSRGAHSGLYSIVDPPSDEARRVLRERIRTTYAEFKQRVEAGRGLTEAELEPIAGGRVWTGLRAQSLRLVDGLGGIPEAVVAAQSLAGLPQDRTAPLLVVRGGRTPLPPQPFPTGSLAALLDTAQAMLQTHIWAVLPFEGL